MTGENGRGRCERKRKRRRKEWLDEQNANENLSGTGIRQISHRFKSQTGLLLLSPITDIFGSLSRSLSLSKYTPLKSRSYYTVSQSSLMFKGDCLSLNINNSNAFWSRYVMLCHAFRQTN